MLKKTTKRFISIVMAAMMIISMIPFTAFAADETTASDNAGSSTDCTIWDGTTADTSWYDESSSNFTISSAAELAGLAKLVNEGNSFSGKTITLNADIDLGGKEWTPIGTSSNKFQGAFDGDEKTISNLKITREIENIAENNNIGFFGASTGSAKIQNFTRRIVKSSATPQNDTIQTVSGNLKSFVVVY